MHRGPKARRVFRSAKGERPFVIAALLLLLVCRATAEFHSLVVPHVPCSEHGEAIEIVLASPCAPAHRGHCGPEIDSSTAQAEGHEHCHLATASNEHILVCTSAERALEPAPELFTPRAGDPSQAWESFPRYLLAPSNSPPA
jgi:hypothetical protein